MLQEALVAFYAAVCDFDPGNGSTFSAFAFLVVGRRLETFVRWANREKHKPLTERLNLSVVSGSAEDGEVLELHDLLADTGSDPVEVLVRREELEIVIAVIRDDLSPWQAEVADGLMNGYSYTDLGSQKSVDNAVQHVRRKVRAALEEAA